jgi:glycosyltransferase XagB
LAHPVADALPAGVFTALCIVFFVTEALSITLCIRGLAKTKHKLNPLWVPTLYFYHPLATLAAYKAAWEMLTKPFYWDKTSHGHFDQVAP